jgi:autotransporter translocation and assembly factor TamB
LKKGVRIFKGRRLWILVVAGIVVLGVIAVRVFAGPLLHAAAGMAGRAAGYAVSYDALENADGRITIERPDVASLSGEPVFTAGRIDISYSLKDIVGGPYFYGISGIDIERPKITIVHHKDGSYNINIPQSNPNEPAKPFTIPTIHAVVKDGSVGILDETRIFAHSRHLALEAVNVDADLHPQGRSSFTFGLSVLEEGGKFPITGRGTFDETRGYELSRVRAKTLALAPLVDYALNSPTLHVANGVLNDLDARFYGLLDHAGNMERHLSGSANIDHFQPYLGGIVKPLRDGRGSLRLYDDGLTIPKVDGSIAGIPVRISGAIYNLTAPKLRLGIEGKGDLRRLITLADAAKKLPLSGPLSFELLVEGDAALPTTFATFASPRMHYANIPLDRLSGLVALRGQETAILRAGLDYDGIAVGTRGRIVSTKHTDVDMLATIHAPAQRLPYAGRLLGPMLLNASAVAMGVDANVETSGAVTGTSPGHTLAGAFDVKGNGVGTLGPVELQGPNGRSLYARVALDRPRGGGGAAFVSARAFNVSTVGAQPALPGIALAPLPALDVTLDGDAAGALEAKHYTAGGSAHLYDSRAFGFPIQDVTAKAVVGDGEHVALEARYRGALAPLAAAAGGKFAARGSVDIPVTVLADGSGRAIAQISGARFQGATIAGVSIDALDATIGLRGKSIDVYAAQARLDGNTIVARGSFGNGGTLDVSTSGIDLAALRAAGLPVRGGTLSAVASIGGTAAAPTVHGGVIASDVTLPNPAYAGLAVTANTGLSYDGTTLHVDDALVRAGPAVASLDGRVNGLRGNPANASYAFDARVREADIGKLAAILKAPLAYPEGSLDADVRVAGSGSRPAVRGNVSIPEGSVNGLGFRDAAVTLSGNAGAIEASGGRVTVGTSVIGFSAAATSAAQTFALHAPRVDLADLNDYFDRGDTLGGRGSIDASVRNEPDRIVTSGRVRLAHTKFRRFDLGATRADWSTAGRRIDTNFALGTTAGQVRTSGSVTLPASRPLRNTLGRSVLALTTHAQGVDLGTWLPAAGIIAPVSGLVDANANVRGVYPNVNVDAHAAVTNGMVRTVPIRTASIDLAASRGRVTIAKAALAIDNASATASGSAGLQPSAPLDLSVVATVADVGALAKSLGGKTVDASGALITTLHVTGTQQRPLLADTLDATSLRYERFTIPRAHLDASLSKTRATLASAEVDFASGRLLANGSVPIVTQPISGQAVGVAENAPLSLNVTADHIDLGQFAALLPKGTQAAGTINGTVGVVGTRARPGLRGDLALSNGTFVGPQLTSKLTDGVAELAFADRTVRLENASVAIGGGTISASGLVTVPDLRNPAQSASANLAIVSKYAVIDAPKFIKGRVNGNISIVRAPGAPAQVTGNLAFSSTRISTTALTPSSAPSPSATQAALPVAFDLGIDVGDDVRVQGGPVDIGAKGHLQVGGTLAAPTVDGELASTGGTLSFYRTFTLQYPSTVHFDPSNGVIPNVDAVATTSVDNPPTDVTLHVTGPATSLNVALASDPSYSREQILGLLVGAQALGAVSGVATTNGGGPQRNPFQAAAEGQLGGLLTQNILEPFSSQLGSAVGLNNLALNYTPGGGASIGAQKRIFKDVDAVFAESFTYPQRQSIGFRASPNNATAIQLTFFSQPESNQFNIFQGAQAFQSTNPSVTDTQPATGSNGFSLSLQRKF